MARKFHVCLKCNNEFEEHIPSTFEHPLLSATCSQECFDFLVKIQPERSKREDSSCYLDENCPTWCGVEPDLCGDHSKCKIEMRCSEHDRNIMRDK